MTDRVISIYETLADVPSDFVGLARVGGDTTNYSILINATKVNGVITRDSHGSSDSIADRPSSAALGKGSWQVGNDIYYSDASTWSISTAESMYDVTLPAAGAQVLDTTPLAVIPVTGTISAISVVTSISGWGGQFTTTSGLIFSHINIKKLTQTTSVPADFWQTITVNVRAGSKYGSIVASGTYSTTPYSTTYSDVLIELWSGGTPKVVTESDVGDTYWVEYTATNRDGGRCSVGFSHTTIKPSNFIYTNVANVQGVNYQKKSDGLWDPNITSTPYYLAVEPFYYSAKTVIPASSQITNELLLPPIYAVVGRECNVYFDGLTSEQYDKLAWDVTCAIGTQQNERFTVIPIAAAAAEPLTISALDPATLSTVATKVGSIKVADAAAAGTLNCLFIGDSTTAAGQVVTEVNVLDTADASIALTMLGTQGTGANLHEGRSGWTAAMFTTTGSPFFIGGVIDFAAYMTANSYSSVDRVIINLGINDVGNSATDTAAIVSAETCINNIGKLVTSIQSYSATCIIGIALTTPPSFNQDAFGKNYGAGLNFFRYKRNITILYSKMLAKFSGKTANKIWLLPYNVSIDTVHNMSLETVAVNSRNATTVVRQSNGVHPDTSGYLQIADAAYAWIKCTL